MSCMQYVIEIALYRRTLFFSTFFFSGFQTTVAPFQPAHLRAAGGGPVANFDHRPPSGRSHARVPRHVFASVNSHTLRGRHDSCAALNTTGVHRAARSAPQCQRASSRACGGQGARTTECGVPEQSHLSVRPSRSCRNAGCCRRVRVAGTTRPHRCGNVTGR